VIALPRLPRNCFFRQLQEKVMKQKIRITTCASQIEKRKQEHLNAGYRIEDEQPFPINGFCSFTAVLIVEDDELERMPFPQANHSAG
jgi:hypothetical protein